MSNIFDCFDIRYHNILVKHSFFSKTPIEKIIYSEKSFVEEVKPLCMALLSTNIPIYNSLATTAHIDVYIEDEEERGIFELRIKKIFRTKSNKVQKLNEIVKLIREEVNRNNKDFKVLFDFKKGVFDKRIITISTVINEKKDICLSIRFCPNMIVFVELFDYPYLIPDNNYAVDLAVQSLLGNIGKTNHLDFNFFFYDHCKNKTVENVEGNIFVMTKEGHDYKRIYLLRTDFTLGNIFLNMEVARKVITHNMRLSYWAKDEIIKEKNELAKWLS